MCHHSVIFVKVCLLSSSLSGVLAPQRSYLHGQVQCLACIRWLWILTKGRTEERRPCIGGPLLIAKVMKGMHGWSLWKLDSPLLWGHLNSSLGSVMAHRFESPPWYESAPAPYSVWDRVQWTWITSEQESSECEYLANICLGFVARVSLHGCHCVPLSKLYEADLMQLGMKGSSFGAVPDLEARCKTFIGDSGDQVSCVPYGRDKTGLDVYWKAVDIYAEAIGLVWTWQLSYILETCHLLLCLRTGGSSCWTGKNMEMQMSKVPILDVWYPKQAWEQGCVWGGVGGLGCCCLRHWLDMNRMR